MASEPYVRVFRRIVDDPRFEAVYDDNRALATWLRLRLAADASWPASASLPYGVSKAAVSRLEAPGLITVQTNGRFRMPDLDEDRAQRTESASNAAKSRWSNADVDQPALQTHTEGNAPAMPTRAEQNSSSQHSPEQRRAELAGVADVETAATPELPLMEQRQTARPDHSWDGTNQLNGDADHGTATSRRLPT